MNKIKSGFTLVEIMITVAIIALLAAITVPNLIRARVTANDTTAKAALKAISNALESYIGTNSTYPPNTAALIGVAPPYLSKDYFTGTYNGFSFNVDTLTDYQYQFTAIPQSSNFGTRSFTISTGGVLVEN